MMWSYSKIKDFFQCPRMYQEKRVLKTFKYIESPEAARGTRLHAAFEHYVKDGTPIPPEFERHKHFVESLASAEGIKLTEYQMACDANRASVPYYDPTKEEPKGWEFNPAAFIGGIADLIIIDERDTATYVDYKTGKGQYPDKDQCELMSMLLMQEFPHLRKVDTALLFVDANKIVEKSYFADDLDAIWGRWMEKIARIETASKTDVWQQKPSGLCKYCQARTCPNWSE